MLLRELQEKYGICPKKRLGQNFLTEQHVISRITEAVLAEGCNTVLEIGPGPGILTEGLAASGRRLICVETDEAMLDILSDRFGALGNVELVKADFLRWDMQPLGETEAAVVGNLPYYITTPIVERLTENRQLFCSAVIMVQKEVAERLMAPPGTREAGALTLFCSYYWELSRVCMVSRGCFWPAPKVDSCVIRMKRRAVPPVAVSDEKLLFSIVRAAFGMRRKTLYNALRNSSELWWGAEKTSRILEKACIDGTRRGENLTLCEFAALTEAAAEYMNPRVENSDIKCGNAAL